MKKISLKYVQTAVYFLNVFILGLLALIKGTTLPDLAGNTGSSISQITYIFTASSIGYLISTIVSGWVFDRVKGHRLMAIAMLLMAGLLAIIPQIDRLAVLIALFALTGFCQGVMDLGSNTLILWVHGEKSAPFMNALHFFFGLGAFITPLIVSAVVIKTGSINWAYWIASLSFIPAIVLTFLVPSPAIRKSQPRNPHSLAPDVSKSHRVLLLLIFLTIVLYVGSEIGFSDWIYTYADSQLPAAPTQQEIERTYQIASTFWVAMTIGRFLSIPLSLKFKPRTLLTIDMAGAFISMAVILLGGSSITTLWIGTIMLGLSLASIFPLLFTLTEQLMDVSGKISSFLMVGSSLGGLFFPWLMGQLFEFVSPFSTMVTVGAAVLLDCVVFGLLFVAIPRSKTKLQG